MRSGKSFYASSPTRVNFAELDVELCELVGDELQISASAASHGLGYFGARHLALTADRRQPMLCRKALVTGRNLFVTWTPTFILFDLQL